MNIDLEEPTGLPIRFDANACRLTLGKGLNRPELRTRTVRDHEPVWSRPVYGDDRTIYFYTSGLWMAEDEAAWKEACVAYGIVVFLPGVFGGEYVKSAGQYHPVCGANRQATPEVYTVLHGTGHFLLQRSVPPYDTVDDAVLVEVLAGETFVVPPDYGHLQINPAPEPLIFSYAVMDGMRGVYEPFRRRRGAVYYEMADGPERYVANPRYDGDVPLRGLKAAELRQVPGLGSAPTYQMLRDRLPRLGFLTDPAQFPENAHLPAGTVLAAPGRELRHDGAEPSVRGERRAERGAPTRTSV